MPHKFKFLLWQGLQEAISTYDTLLYHHFQTEETCMLCQAQVETQEHLFFRCPAARFVWMELNLHQLIAEAESPSSSEWIGEIIRRLKSRDRDMENPVWMLKFGLGFWTIWMQRNKAKFGQGKDHPMQLIFQVRYLINQLQKAFHAPLVLQSKKQQNVSWQPPNLPFVMINSDGAADAIGNMGSAIVFRDSNAAFLWAGVLPGRGGNALVAETIAVWLALLVINQMRLKKVIIQMDSQVLFNILTAPEKPRPVIIAQYLKDILHWVQQNSEIQFQWKYREANMVADGLATFALHQAQSMNWWVNPITYRQLPMEFDNNIPPLVSYWSSTPPSFIHSLLLGDMMNVQFQRVSV